MTRDVEPNQFTIRKWSIRLAMLLPAIWFACAVVIASGHRDAYPFASPLDAFFYPVGSVVTSVALMVAELVGIDVLMNRRQPTRIWRRAALGAVVIAPISWSSVSVVAETPPYVTRHELWLVVVNLLLLLQALGSILCSVVQFARERIRPRV